MTADNAKKLGKSIGFMVGVAPKELTALVNDYGWYPTTRKELIKATVELTTGDAKFFSAYRALLSKKNEKLKKVQKEKFQNVNGTETSGGSSFDWGGLVGGVLTAGSGIFTSIKATEAQKALAESQAQISANETQSAIQLGQLQLEAERVRLEQEKLKSSSPKSNTMVYVAIGIGVLVLAGGAILIFRK